MVLIFLLYKSLVFVYAFHLNLCIRGSMLAHSPDCAYALKIDNGVEIILNKNDLDNEHQIRTIGNGSFQFPFFLSFPYRLIHFLFTFFAFLES